MSDARSYDAIVVGGGPNGLIAASYLGRAGKRVLLLDAQDKLGRLHASASPDDGDSTDLLALYALDPLVVRDLKLPQRGLRFARHELALTGLRRDGKHIVISRDMYDTASSIAFHSRRDAAAWPRFRRDVFELARTMRPLWWDARGTLPSRAYGQEIVRIAHMSASAWLDSWFESDALKATLLYDSIAGGLSVLEPGSALSLVWRAAQEILGRQGAVVPLQGGFAGLIEVLQSAARDAGCEIRTDERINRVILEEDRVAGVQIQSGETCFAPMVFSAASSSHTFLRSLPPEALGIASSDTSPRISSISEASVVMTLRNTPQIAPDPILPASRFVVVDRAESFVTAEMAARAGMLPDEIPIEFTASTIADATAGPSGRHVLSARVRPVPRLPNGGWTALAPTLAAHVVKSVERFSPGLSRDIVQLATFLPDHAEPAPVLSVRHMMTTAAGRVETPVGGLFFCGDGAEPVPALSGRAARIAVKIAMAGHP